MAVDVRCKGVHVKLDKKTHMNFKMRLVQHGLSMQEAFAEFARQVGNENLSANRLLEKLLRERVKEVLKDAGVKPSRRRKPRYVTELDDDGLYDLINEVEDEEAEG
jgi:hypothetical protein